MSEHKPTILALISYYFGWVYFISKNDVMFFLGAGGLAVSIMYNLMGVALRRERLRQLRKQEKQEDEANISIPGADKN